MENPFLELKNPFSGLEDPSDWIDRGIVQVNRKTGQIRKKPSFQGGSEAGPPKESPGAAMLDLFGQTSDTIAQPFIAGIGRLADRNFDLSTREFKVDPRGFDATGPNEKYSPPVVTQPEPGIFTDVSQGILARNEELRQGALGVDSGMGQYGDAALGGIGTSLAQLPGILGQFEAMGGGAAGKALGGMLPATAGALPRIAAGAAGNAIPQAALDLVGQGQLTPNTAIAAGLGGLFPALGAMRPKNALPASVEAPPRPDLGAPATLPRGIEELASKSLEIGQSPPAAMKTPVTVVSKAPGVLQALDDSGRQVGDLHVTPVPGGGFTVDQVFTGQKGSGAGRALYQKAAEMFGPYKGSVLQTAEGQGFVNRLRETDPQIFGDPAGPTVPKLDIETTFRQKFFSQRPGKAPLADRAKAGWDNLKRQMGDDWDPYRRTIRAITENPGDRRHAEVVTDAVRGSAATAMTPVEHHTRYFDPELRDYKITGEPLTAIIDKLDPQTFERAENYLAATRHVEDLETRGSYMGGDQKVIPGTERLFSNALHVSEKASEDARSLLSAYDEAGLTPQLKVIADRYRQWSYRSFIEPLRKAGILSEIDETTIMGAGPNYAFFLRGGLDDALAKKGIDISSVDAELQPAFLKPAGGASGTISQRSSPVKEIKAGLSEHMKIAPIFEASALQAARIDRMVTRQNAKNYLSEVVRKEIEANPALADSFEVRPVKNPHPPEAERGTYIEFKDGEKIAWKAPEDLLNVLDRLSPRESQNVIQAAAKMAARTVRTLATTTFRFAGRNIVRDQPSAGVFTENGLIPIYDPAKILIQEAVSRATGKGPTPAWQNWLEIPAHQSNFLAVDQGSMFDVLKRSQQVARPGGKAKALRWDLLTKPLAVPRMISNTLEAATRIAEIELARKGGRKTFHLGKVDLGLPIPGTAGSMPPKTGALASLEGSEVSQNFKMMGSWVRKMNQYVPFLGAEFGDVTRFSRAMREKPLTTSAKAFAYITLPSLLEIQAHSGDPDYERLSPWRKAAAYHLGRLPNGWWITIPKPLGLIQLVFGDLPGLAFANMKRDDPKLFQRAIGSIVEQTPAHFIGNAHKDGTLGWSADALPALVKPPIEVAMNYDTYRDQPLEGQYVHQRSPELRYTERTSPTMKLLGEKIGESPIMLEHLYKGYLPGYGEVPLKLADWALGKSPLKGDLRDTPILGGFVDPPPIGFQSDPVMQLLNKAKQASADMSTLKRLAKGMHPAELDALKKKYPAALQSHMLNNASEQLNDLYSLREDTLADKGMTEEQRKDRLLQIDQRVSQIAMQALDLLDHTEELKKNPFSGMIGGTH